MEAQELSSMIILQELSLSLLISGESICASLIPQFEAHYAWGAEHSIPQFEADYAWGAEHPTAHLEKTTFNRISVYMTSSVVLG